MSTLHAVDALIPPPAYRPPATAFRDDFSIAEVAALKRYVKLATDLARCRYFTEEERSEHVTFEAGKVVTWEQTLPEIGATRGMITLLRQLFGDGNRASFAKVALILREHALTASPEGLQLFRTVRAYELAKQGVLDSWDARPGGTEAEPEKPLTVLLDFMYGELLHSEAEKAERIAQLDTEWRLYEWQFHWVVERLSVLYTHFRELVEGVVDQHAAAPS